LSCTLSRLPDGNIIDRGIRSRNYNQTYMEFLRFATSLEFRRWLETNHALSDGIWLRFFKKNSGEQSVTYAQALDEALCFGWIDGQLKSHDELSWLQKFTPRRRKSQWSKRNTSHVERLIQAGAMTTAGLESRRDGKKPTAAGNRSHAVGLGSASVLARRLRRLAEGIRKCASFTKGWLAFVLRPVGGTPTGSDRDGRAPLFQLHG
jgi:hypothetical protein